MLRNIYKMIGFAIQSEEAIAGTIDDIFITTTDWTLRYLSIDLENWPLKRHVLIEGRYLLAAGISTISVDLSMDQILDSPGTDTITAIQSSNGEDQYLLPENERLFNRKQKGRDHIMSIMDLKGLRIQASDGECGHVEDMILDDERWEVEYLVVDTRNWFPGKKVLLPPQWNSAFDRDTARLIYNISRSVIQESPEYDPEVPIMPDYELRLFTYYDRKPYWID